MGAIEQFWTDVEKKCDERGVETRHVHSLREALLQGATDSPAVAAITADTSESFETAIEWCVTLAQRNQLREKLRLCEKRLANKKEAFWIAIEQELGLEGNLSFCPAMLRLVKGESDDSTAQNASASYKETINEYQKLIKEALYSPLTAHRMSKDGTLPGWLQTLASEITDGNLRPTLRSTLEEVIDDAALAEAWYNAASQRRWPQWFLDTMNVLAGGARYAPPPSLSH